MGEGLSKIALYYYCTQEDEAAEACWQRRGLCELAVPSAVRQPTDTVIIFDWDDTLLCSTAINRQDWHPQQLQQLERNVGSILRMALRLGETHIVTNGNQCWVQDSATHFLPSLLPTLERLQIMSARAAYEQVFPGDPFQWKRQAFKELLARRETQLSAKLSEGVNLVVLGDSLAEIEAAGTATKVVPGHSIVKTVKFKELPSANELLGQLRKVKQELRKIVHLECSASKNLVQRPLPAHLDHLSAWASGWRVCEAKTPGFVGPLASLFGA